jgi:uncharacterized protein
MSRIASVLARMAVAAMVTVFSIHAVAAQATGTGERVFKQSALARQVNEGTVTVVTDGLTERSGLVSQLAGELAKTVDEEGRLRLLPMLGYGARANVRDLLYLRGIDLGILNADVLKYLELQGELPAAQRKLRYVTRLLDKTIFIAATPDISDFNDLRGRKILVIGKESDGHVTARTLLALAGIDATLVFGDWDNLAQLFERGDAQAVIALERNAVDLERRLGKDLGLKLVPIPMTPALQTIYESRNVAADEAPDLVPAGGMATLTVPTVLAVFNWRKTQARYGSVNGFVRSLFGAIGRLQASDTTGLWSQIDPRRDVAGWQRYEPVQTLLAALPSAWTPTTQVAAVTEPTSQSPQTAVAATPVPATEMITQTAVTTALASAQPQPVPATTEPKAARVDVAIGPLPTPLVIAAAPQVGLISDKAPEQGLLAEVLTRRLVAARGGKTKSPDRIDIAGSVTSNLARLKKDRSIDAVLVSRPPDCAVGTANPQPVEAASGGTGLCQDFLFTKPVFQVVLGFFRLPKGPTFDSEDDAIGRSICVVEATDVSDLDADGRHWLKDDRITLVRQPTVEACFAQLATGVVEWVYSDEFSGRAAIAALDPNAGMEIGERPVSIAGYHLAIDRQRAGAAGLLASLNAALSSPAADDAIAAIVAKRMVSDTPAVTQN